jgi:biotin carboxyl carrier protein
LPERARVLRILPSDGDDLEAGQVVLELEAL